MIIFPEGIGRDFPGTGRGGDFPTETTCHRDDVLANGNVSVRQEWTSGSNEWVDVPKDDRPTPYDKDHVQGFC